MARQFNARITQQALRDRLASVPVQAPHETRGLMLAMTPASEPESGGDGELIRDWLTELHLLKGVPFNYLVPDIGMLPAESLRFFQVDNAWIDALLDGAFSLGSAKAAPSAAQYARQAFHGNAVQLACSGAVRRAMRAEQISRAAPHACPPPVRQEAQADAAPQVLSGFLLRSIVINGWPGLEVEGFADVDGKLPLDIVRMEVVAPALLLCIFAGVVEQVRFKGPSEAVHFGVDAKEKDRFCKNLRNANSSANDEVGSYTNTKVSGSFRDGVRRSVIQMDALANSMAAKVWTTSAPTGPLFTAAQFALEMVEGVEVVSFRRSDTR